MSEANPHNFPEHKEDFEVVMMKEGVNEMTATPDDFKRIAVSASSPLAAQMDDTVMKEKGWNALFATKPNVMTDPEIAARRRVMEGAAVDRSKI